MTDKTFSTTPTVPLELIDFPDIDIDTIPEDRIKARVKLIKRKCPEMDIRTGIVYAIFEEYQNGNVLLYKTVRAGATTSLGVASIDRKEQCLIVVPTNKIARETVIADIENLRPHANIIQILSNHYCVINREMCEEHPDLNELQFLPLEQNCGSLCEYFDECPIMEVLRHPDADIFVITADKLSALMLAASVAKKSEKPSTAFNILNILGNSRNIVFDEIHWMQSYTPTSLTTATYRIGAPLPKYLDLAGKYTQIVLDWPNGGQYKTIPSILVDFAAIIQNERIEEASKNVLDKIKEPDYHEKHANELLKNPIYDLMDNSMVRKQTVALCTEAINMIKNEDHRSKYNLTMPDINMWFSMASIVSSQFVQVNAIRSNDNINVNIDGHDRVKLAMMEKFIRSAQLKGDKRIILTSATLGSYNYDNLLLEGTEFNKIMFGDKGDPLITNSKMLILADSKKYSITKGKYSILNNILEIAYYISQVLDEFGDDCLIIAANMDSADYIQKTLENIGYKHDVTYYNSDKTIGVTSKARVAIAIGAAYAPTHTYDVITKTREESSVILEETMNAATWQAWCRVKDPEGKAPSIVIAIGVNVDQCENIATWGFDREVTIDDHKQGMKKPIIVECSKYITKPKIEQCGDFGSTLLMAKKHMSKGKTRDLTASKEKILDPMLYCKKIGICEQQSNCPNPLTLPTYNYNILLGSVNGMRVSPDRLLNLIFSQEGVGTLDFVKLDGNKLKWHMKGKNPLKTPIVSKEGNVSWIQFQGIKLEGDKKRLCGRLTSANIPYMVEFETKVQSYNIWIFLKPISAKYAKKFGEKILQDIEVLDKIKLRCELLPKYTNQKSSNFKTGNEIKLPLHPNSRILVNEEFVPTFETLDIGIVDLTKFAKWIEIREAFTIAGFEGDQETQKALVEEYESLFS